MIEQIRSLVEQTRSRKDRTWVAGKDFVPYAGPYFDDEEYVVAIESLLSEWLVMGNKSIQFERRFPKLFDKSRGILTNSGSSSNLLMMTALTSKRSYNLSKGTKVQSPPVDVYVFDLGSSCFMDTDLYVEAAITTPDVDPRTGL